MTIPKLSILTPVINGERFIEGCLESVIKQNCPEVEHIICDGFSSDKTCSIVKAYTKKYPHILLDSRTDGGQSEAMNRALSLSKAPIVGFLNVDDFYEPGVLKRVVDIFKKAPEPTLVIGNCKMVGQNDTLLQINIPEARTQIDILKGKTVPYNPSAYFYHKSLHNIIGSYDNEDHYVMDLDFLLRAFHAANILYFNETWGNFRFIEGRKTFDDYHSGNMWNRRDSLFQKYESALPLSTRLQIKIYKRASHFLLRLRRKLHRSCQESA
jgi:glycosyltransferase involved in cell wall biosynthesis